MHWDIPPRRYSQTKLLLLYFKWSILGILGPELVIFVAWRQLNSANTLSLELRKASEAYLNAETKEDDGIDSRPTRTDAYSNVHGFYGSMGGYIFDFERNHPIELAPCIPALSRLTVTARGVAFLAKCGLLPEVSLEDIEDRSKIDHLAKTLVLLQAAWFLFQVFGRVAQHLPLTLLEINTLAYVACALLVYMLWWNKPAMIYVPTYLVGDWVPAICAYMYMSSRISIGERDRFSVRRKAGIDSELSALVYIEPFLWEAGFLRDSTAQSTVDVSLDRPRHEGRLQARFEVSKSLASDEKAPKFSKSQSKVSSPSVGDIQRWRLVEQAISKYPAIAARLIPTEMESVFTEGHEKMYTFLTEELLAEYSSNYPSAHLLRGTGGLVMGMILWGASIAFGVIHLAAWHDSFPSVIEGWLWRASAIWIACSGAIWFFANLLARICPQVDEFWEDTYALRLNWVAGTFLIIVCTVCGVAYVASRVFLVVEAFISIRALPQRAYDTPDWSQVIPHL